MALTIFFFVCDLCGLPFGVFLAFYDERLQSGLGLALFFVLCYFFEFGEPEPGRGASRFDCDSVWRVESLLPLVKPAMPVIWPAWILCSLFAPLFFCAISSMLGHEAYVFGRPSDYSSWVGAAAGKSCVDKAVAVGARRARYGWLEGLRNAL